MNDKEKPSDNSQDNDNATANWSSIRQRLDRLRNMIDSGWSVGPERVNAILAARARKLAQPLNADEPPGKMLEIVEFSLARENYGVESRYVREVFPLLDFIPVPCTPAFVLGIVNVRGQIVSIVDLRKFFGLPGAGITDLNKIIVLENADMCFGIVADFIIDVRQIAAHALLPPANICGIAADCLLGVTPQSMAVIDTEKLLRDKRAVVDEVVSN